MEQTNILKVKNLKTYFHTEEGLVRAVDDVSFEIKRGETLGVVGESGCGKSMTSRSIMNLVPEPRGKIEGGKIYYYKNGIKIDITALRSNSREMRSIRGNDISMIFQEPMTSLNPVYTIGEQIMETIRLHKNVEKDRAQNLTINILEKVGISAPEQRILEYPHQLSGGMRQRVMIAMSLVCDPEFLIADEPTTALDVTIEAQILKLMKDLQNEFEMSIMFITHDLGVIGEMADRVIVMYTGTIMEKASTDAIFYNNRHPYTRGLLDSIPRIGENKNLVPIEGSVPDLKSLPTGCYFAPRCPLAKGKCYKEEPGIYTNGDHSVKCWLYVVEEDFTDEREFAGSK